jgi:hypothetical protein
MPYRIDDNPISSEHPLGETRFAKPTSKLWPLVILVGSVLIVLLAVAAILRFTVARKLPVLTPARLQAAEERWHTNGPADYNMDVNIKGNRPGTVQVEVRKRVVTKMVRDGQTPSQQRTWDVWSVPGMFDTLEREIELAEDPEREMQAERGTKLWLKAEFDPDYGYPARFHRAVFGGGPEVYWHVTRFQPKAP